MILVQPLRARHDCITTFCGEGPPQGPGSGGGFSLVDAELLSQVLEHLGFLEEPRLKR